MRSRSRCGSRRQVGTSRATDVGPGSRTDNSTGISRGGARPAGRPRWLGVCPPFIFRCVTIHPSVVPEHSGARGGSSCFTVRHPFEMTRGLRPRTFLHHPAGGHTASVRPPIIVSVLVIHKPREEEDLLRPAMQTRPERQTCFAPCRAQHKYLPLLSEGQHSLHNVTRHVGGRVPVSRSSGALGADESWPSSGLLAAQRKGKAASASAAHVALSLGVTTWKGRFRGAILESRTKRGCCSFARTKRALLRVARGNKSQREGNANPDPSRLSILPARGPI